MSETTGRGIHRALSQLLSPATFGLISIIIGQFASSERRYLAVLEAFLQPKGTHSAVETSHALLIARPNRDPGICSIGVDELRSCNIRHPKQVMFHNNCRTLQNILSQQDDE
jgi:hypothetical protein